MSAPTPVDVVDDGGAFSTLVIEDGVIPRRVRRPADLLRLAIALVAFAVTVAITYFLNATSAGIEQDLVQASTGLPAIAGTVLNLIGGLGVLLLPVAAGIDMIVRRRGRQLVDAMARCVARPSCWPCSSRAWWRRTAARSCSSASPASTRRPRSSSSARSSSGSSPSSR